MVVEAACVMPVSTVEILVGENEGKNSTHERLLTRKIGIDQSE